MKSKIVALLSLLILAISLPYVSVSYAESIQTTRVQEPRLIALGTAPNTSVTCKLVEINPRYSDNVVSGKTTQIAASQNLALVASILNDDANHTSIQWKANGGTFTNTSWDLTEWRAPTTPGTYTVEMSIYGVPQPNCTSQFIVMSGTSSVTCTKVETTSRYSGNILSGTTSAVFPEQRVPLIASINNDDGNHTSIIWNTTDGMLRNYAWDLIDWIAPDKAGTYTVTMSIYGAPQPLCTVTFIVSQVEAHEIANPVAEQTIQSKATPLAEVKVTNENTKQQYTATANLRGEYKVRIPKQKEGLLKVTTKPNEGIFARILQFFFTKNPKPILAPQPQSINTQSTVTTTSATAQPAIPLQKDN